jgi:flavin-dependent dehydrogenase
MKKLEPLRNGQRVAVIGGGPGGVGAALTLIRAAREHGVKLEVLLFECKRFGEQQNQCMGVLSPPLLTILRQDFGIELPQSIIQRNITGYVLATSSDEVLLECESEAEFSYAVRRVQLDSFLLSRAEESGVKVFQSRVTDLEFSSDGLMIYSDSGNWKADAVIGAFGLDSAAADAFERRTPYRRPAALQTVVTRMHPGSPRVIDSLLSGRIYAYLPPVKNVEFGALVPKGDHISIVVAGKDVTAKDMDSFLRLPEVARMLPAGRSAESYFKGSFPLGSAARIYGDRYAIVGDAAGLVRPFKGKGINSALLTGRYAAGTMIEKGTSERALRHFYRACGDFTSDVAYGRLMRFLAITTANHFSVGRIIALAKRSPAVRRALFDCVSGHRPFRDIVRDNLSPSFTARVLKTLLLEGLLDRVTGKRTLEERRTG